MREMTLMTTEQLQKRADELKQEEFEVMKELIRRGWGHNLPDTLEHPDMKQTEEDF